MNPSIQPEIGESHLTNPISSISPSSQEEIDVTLQTTIQNVKEEKQYSIPLNIKATFNGSSHGHALNQSVTFRISDEKNPHFLFYQEINSSNYSQIKDINQLRIEMTSFYSDYLKKRLPEVAATQQQFMGSDNFNVSLEINHGEAKLLIVKQEQWKVENVLDLPLNEATDSYLKTYLSDRLKAEVTRVEDLSSTLEMTRQELHSSMVQKDQIAHEFEEMKNNNLKVQNSIREEKSKTVHDIESKNRREFSELQSAAEKERRKIHEEHENQIQKLNVTLEEMNDKIKNLESENRDLMVSEKRLETMTHNYEKVEAELQNLQDGKQSDGSTLTEQRIEISRLSTEKIQLEKEINSRNEIIESKDQILEAKEKDISHLNEEKDQVSANFEKATKKCQSLVDNIKDANEKIQLLNQRVKKYKNMSKERDAIIEKLEQQINLYRAEMDQQRREIADKESEFKRKEIDCEKAVRECENLRQSLDTATQDLEKNKSLIAYLSKNGQASPGLPTTSVPEMSSTATKFQPSTMSAYEKFKSGTNSFTPASHTFTSTMPASTYKPAPTSYTPSSSNFQPSTFTRTYESIENKEMSNTTKSYSSYNPASSLAPPPSSGANEPSGISASNVQSSMKQSPSASSISESCLSMNSISQGNPLSEDEIYVKEQPMELKDTARSNNNTATFYEDKENKDQVNQMSLPITGLQNTVADHKGLPSNLLITQGGAPENEYSLDESEDDIQAVQFMSEEISYTE